MAAVQQVQARPYEKGSSERDGPNSTPQDHPTEILKTLEAVCPRTALMSELAMIQPFGGTNCVAAYPSDNAMPPPGSPPQAYSEDPRHGTPSCPCTV